MNKLTPSVTIPGGPGLPSKPGSPGSPIDTNVFKLIYL